MMRPNFSLHEASISLHEAHELANGESECRCPLMVENEKDSVGCRNRGSIWQSEIVDHRVSSSAPSGRKASTEDAKVT